VVAIEGFSQAIQIREEGLPSRAQWEKELRASRPYWAGEPRQKPIGKYEEEATGRLAITLLPSFGGRKWADRKSWTLEEKLPEVIQEIEISAAADQHRREEAERAKERRQREWRPRRRDTSRLGAPTSCSREPRLGERLRRSGLLRRGRGAPSP
jgi:hypothetical protein